MQPALPATKVVMVEVAGLDRPDYWRYVLRFDREGRPSLYQDGHRLTCAWRLSVDLSQPADAHGENGNTSNG